MTPIISFEKVLKDINIRPSIEATRLASKFGYRPYMVERYIEILGLDEVKELLEAFEKPLTPSIRCNTLKLKDCDLLIKYLESKGYVLKRIEWHQYGYRILNRGKPRLGATREYLLGYYYLYRGVASQLPPLVMNPKPHTYVLDMAAAPGGKLTHIAQLMNNTGLILGIDISRSKIRALRSHINRLGVLNTVLLRADSIKAINSLGLEDFFDYVLLDAPCTGEGIIQIDKSRKVKTTLEDLAKFVTKQIEMLVVALKVVKPGGIIIYSTCSIAPEENEYVVSKALEFFRGEAIVETPSNYRSLFSQGLIEFHKLKFREDLKNALRLYPHLHDCEGFFVCRIRRKS